MIFVLALLLSDPITLTREATTYRWPSAKVQYYLGDTPGNWREIHGECRRAFAEWRRRTGMKFVEVRQPGLDNSIDVHFTDDPLFPLVGGQLARAYYPPPGWWEPLAGDIYIRPDIQPMGEYRDIYSVMLHEIGHALGLPHMADSVMAPTYTPHRILWLSDVAAWKGLYVP